MSPIESFVFQWRMRGSKYKINVVGDAMIDQYFDVEATRISPEFPIPVMRSHSMKPTESKPGGAANVAYQMTPWNIDSKFFFLSDQEAYKLFKNHIPGIHGVTSEPVPSPRKMRIYDGKHPTFRWDIESPPLDWVLDGVQPLLQERYEKEANSNGYPDVLILSDYNKGLFSTNFAQGLDARRNWISAGNKSTVIVDPKSGPLEGWKGCTIFKPNKKEAEDLSGLKNWKEQCDFFMEELQCQSVVITMGAEGVVGKWTEKDKAHEFFEYKPDFKVDPNSVIGAGDCFVAFLAMAVSFGFSVPEASEIAYKAGACYVRHDRNEPVTPQELLAFDNVVESKFLDPPEPGKRKFTLGFTNGCFDLLHAGHIQSLIFAKKHCDKLVVAVNSDASVRSLKGDNRPHVKLEDRMRMLASLEVVDYVVAFSEATPLKIIKEYRPDVLIKGEDYKDKKVVGSDLVKKVVFAPLMKGRSTTLIERSIKLAEPLEPSASSEASAEPGCT